MQETIDAFRHTITLMSKLGSPVPEEVLTVSASMYEAKKLLPSTIQTEFWDRVEDGF